MDKRLISFEATHSDSEIENDIVLQTFIDGYPEDENAEGQVVAKVIKSKSGDIITVWQLNEYRLNKTVNELIKDVVREMKGA